MCNFRGGAQLTELSQGCVDPTSPNLARTGRSWLHKNFFSVWIYAAFSNSCGSKLSYVENDAKFCTVDPHVKIREGVGEISIPFVEAMTEPSEYIFDGYPLRGCRARWIDKKEKKERKFIDKT